MSFPLIVKVSLYTCLNVLGGYTFTIGVGGRGRSAGKEREAGEGEREVR